MAYCLKCGAKLEDDDIICPFCGGQTGGVGRLKQLSDEMVVDVRTLLHTEDQTDKMDSATHRNKAILMKVLYTVNPEVFLNCFKKCTPSEM